MPPLSEACSSTSNARRTRSIRRKHLFRIAKTDRPRRRCGSACRRSGCAGSCGTRGSGKRFRPRKSRNRTWTMVKLPIATKAVARSVKFSVGGTNGCDLAGFRWLTNNILHGGIRHQKTRDFFERFWKAVWPMHGGRVPLRARTGPFQPLRNLPVEGLPRKTAGRSLG